MKEEDEQRAAFETWAKGLPGWRNGSGWSFERSPHVHDMYYNNRLDDMWKGYRAALAAALPPAAVQAGTSVKRIRETAKHLRENSLRLARYPGMTDEARARELAALYIEEIAWVYEQTMGVDEGTLTAGKQGGAE